MIMAHQQFLVSIAFLASVYWCPFTTAIESRQLSVQLFYDDEVLNGGYDMVYLNNVGAKFAEYLKNGMVPSIHVNITGISYYPGEHNFESFHPETYRGNVDRGSDLFYLTSVYSGGKAVIGSVCSKNIGARKGFGGINWGVERSASIMAHEVGHLLGVGHPASTLEALGADHACTKDDDYGTGFIMETNAANTDKFRYSPCNKQLFQNIIASKGGDDFCLNPGTCGNCYTKGTVGNNENGCPDERNKCECKTGYAGIKCNKCDSYTINRGTDSLPECDSYMSNVRILGNPIVDNEVDSRDECITLCRDNDKCDYSNYHEDSKKCLLFSYSSYVASSDGTVSGLKFCDPDSIETCTQNNIRYPELVVSSTFRKTARQCQYACRGHSVCDIFVWDSSDQKCEYVSFRGKFSSMDSYTLTPREIKVNVGAEIIEEPIQIPDEKCYAKGSMSPGFKDKELGVCQCKPGFTGKLCNVCMPFHENAGSEEEPDCSCYVKNREYTRSQISVVRGVGSVEDCQKHCDEYRGCILFTYVESVCYLSGDFANRKICPGCISGVNFCNGDKNDCHIPGLFWSGLGALAGDIYHMKDSAESCQISCLLEPLCDRWSWVKTGPCYLFRLGFYSTPRSGAITGPPKCEGKPDELAQPTNVKGCYEKGSEGADFYNNDKKSCKCKGGYFGERCDTCFPTTKNTGNRTNPECSSCILENYATSSDYKLTQLNWVVSYAICRMRCDELEGCSSVTFSIDKKICILKGAKESSRDTQGMIGGKKFCNGKDEKECYLKNPKSVNLRIVDTTKEESAKDCHMSCMGNPLCVQWIWNPKDGSNQCIHQGSIKISGKRSIGMISAEKECPVKERRNECYERGSVTKDFYSKEVKVCQCIPGYTGKNCDVCEAHVINYGTEDEPNCGCDQRNVLIFEYSAGFRSGIPSLEKCRSFCQANANCDTFTHLTTGYRYCLMHRGVDSRQTSDMNFVSGPKFCTVAQKSKCYKEGIRWVNLPTVRNGDENKVKNPEECHLSCIKDPSCERWMWNGTRVLIDQGTYVPNGGCTLTNSLDKRGTIRYGASTGPKTCEAGEPFRNIHENEEECNKVGSEGTDYLNNDKKVCKCIDGYHGKYCNGCNPYTVVLNASIPTCSCLMHNAVIHGHDLGKLKMTKKGRLRQCQDLCVNDPNCHAYSYVNRGRWCHKKTENAQTEINTEGMIGGKKFCIGEDPSDCYEENPKWLDLPIVLEGKVNVQQTEKECHMSCMDNTFCKRWIFDKNNGLNYCTLQGSLTMKAVPLKYWVTGLKNCKD